MTPRLQSKATNRPQAGIVHFGVGAFFKAFNGVYTQEAMAQSGGDWGIVGVSLRKPDIRDALKPQGFAYTAITLAPKGRQHQIIDVLHDVLVAPENPAAVLALLALEHINIVSLTITEKGYCHNPANGQLRLDEADILHDLQHPDAPKTAIGYIVHGLALRYAAGLPPFTVLSCDNLPNNGALIRDCVLQFAEAINGDLAAWIAREGRFPATMVDRITPATTPDDMDALAVATGYRDAACVVHEPFRQWVIEDDFVAGAHPDWASVGAQMVADVAPFEAMKLRCLNGAHSALAYLGYLAGHETIAEVMADADFVGYIERLWHDEIIPNIAPPEGVDLAAYCAALQHRFDNPAIQHRTWQIAMDGSQKLPQRLLSTVQDNLDAGRPINNLALAVAGWMIYVGGVDLNKAEIDVRDPLADRLKKASDRGGDPAAKVRHLLAIEAVFGAELPRNDHFQAALIEAYMGLLKRGVKASITVQ